MLWVALGAILLNGGVMMGIQRSGDKSVNLRGAYVHMLGDLLGAIGIVAGSLVIRFTGWMLADPILSAIIAILIIWTAWDVIRESLNILLEGKPRGVELGAVTSAIREVSGVLDVHDLHIWSLGSESHALSTHVLIEDMPPSRSGEILHRINDVLVARFHIHHTTVQFEHANCAISDNGCIIAAVAEHHHH
jgi:cobalt-zinc-cadmium efflux system protein